MTARHRRGVCILVISSEPLLSSSGDGDPDRLTQERQEGWKSVEARHNADRCNGDARSRGSEGGLL